MTCRLRIKFEGKDPVPRSCPTCGLIAGACQYGYTEIKDETLGLVVHPPGFAREVAKTNAQIRLKRQVDYLIKTFQCNYSDSKLVEIIHTLQHLGKDDKSKPSYSSGGDAQYTVEKGTRLMLVEIHDELFRARAKFPSSNLCLAALMEEVGELSQAMLKLAAGKGSNLRVREEAIQVAAMAIRCAIEGDPSMMRANYVDPD